MAYMITSDCINCNACAPECPNEVIYEGAASWSLAGTTYSGNESPSGDASFWSSDYFFVVPEKCTECKGFFDEPQCVSICPVDCCIPDPNHKDDENSLLKKKEYLDSVGR